MSVSRADGTVTASWAAVTGADHYHVTYSTSNGASWSLAALKHTGTSITITADNDATYIVAARAGNTTGWSGWRNSAPAGPYDPPLAAPVQAMLGRGIVNVGRRNHWTLQHLDVSWTGVANADSYQVQCANVYANGIWDVDDDDFGEWKTCVNSVSGTSTRITSSEYFMDREFAYKVRVRAKKSANRGGGWSTWTESPASWPVWRPSEGWVIARGAGRLVVEWHQHGRPLRWGVKYRVYCGTAGAEPTKCADNISPASGGIGSARIDDLDLDTAGVQPVLNGTSYYVGVEAFNATGESGLAVVRHRLFKPLTAPAKFSNVTATRGDGTITVTVHRPAQSWLTSVEMNCDIRNGTNGPCPGSPYTTDWDEAFADRESFTINVGTANNSKVYTITAKGVNDLGKSAASDAVTLQSITAPGQIDSITATRGTGTITVSWLFPSGTYLTFDIECSSDDGTTWTAACTRGAGIDDDGVVTTYIETLTGVSDSTAYKIRARAKNALGTGTWRESAAIPVQPGQIDSITATRGDGTLSLSWTVPASNGVTISGYDIECSSDNGATWTATCTRGTGTTTGTTYSETLTGVTDATAYKVRARAKNANATGPWREVDVAARSGG